MRKNPAPQAGIINPCLLVVGVSALFCSLTTLSFSDIGAVRSDDQPTGLQSVASNRAIVFFEGSDGKLTQHGLFASSFAGVAAPSELLHSTSSTCVPVPLVNDKCPAWDSFYDGPGAGPDGTGEGLLNSRVMAPSPDGQLIYVAGKSDADPSSGIDYDYVVVAFDAATGQQRWAGRYPGTADLPQAVPYALAVSPTGSAVFVTGTTFSADGLEAGTATVGFAADTGEQLWVALFNEPSLFTPAIDAAVSPDGRRVFVAGYGQNPDGTPRNQALVVAYDAETGGRVWFDRYSGDPGDSTLAFKVAANPEGSSVYVAGAKLGAGGQTIDVVLLVYDPLTGHLKKETHHPTTGLPPAGIAVSSDGSRVFIEEGNFETGPNTALTLAYDAAGNELWTARYRGCEELKCASSPWYYGPITVSPDGGRVFVSSATVNRQAVKVFDTLAYDAATGEQKWVSRYEAIGGTFTGPTVAVNSNGKEVYITGFAHASDTTTLAYDSTAGAQKWVGIYKQGADDSGPVAIAVSPEGDRVFVAGAIADTVSGDSNLLAFAYDTGVLPPVHAVSAISRKIHDATGAFDINLPLTGKRGIECRTGGSNGDYQLIAAFASPVTCNSAQVTSGTGSVSSFSVNGDGTQVTANLTDVSTAQRIVVTLNVSDGTTTNDVMIGMAILIGDTNANGVVSNADVASVKGQVAAPVTTSNFRNDVNANGVISNTDVGVAKAQVGTSLP
jgi:hypothetical protein